MGNTCRPAYVAVTFANCGLDLVPPETTDIIAPHQLPFERGELAHLVRARGR